MADAALKAIDKLRAYATQERNSARAIADGADRGSVKMIAAGSAVPASSYYRARQNAMDDILRKLGELSQTEVRP